MKAFFAILFATALTCAVTAAPAAPKIVSPDEAEVLIKETPALVILDVRTPDEFAGGHIHGAKNVDFFGDDFEKQIAALDPAKPVLVHCAAGGRSSQAVEKLAALKKPPVIYHLKAGFNGWKAAKKPVEGKPAEGK